MIHKQIRAPFGLWWVYWIPGQERSIASHLSAAFIVRYLRAGRRVWFVTPRGWERESNREAEN